MLIRKSNIVGLVTAILLIAVSVVLLYVNVSYFDINTFYFVLGIAIVIGGLPFLVNLLLESRIEKNKEQMFLEFSRDLVEGVKSGTPISKSILNVKNRDYGSLTPYIAKLANQISLGIPVKTALDTFARDVNSEVISRAIGLIREADKAGGKIETILESVTFSVSQIEKLKKERKAAIYNLTVQGYIIFLIFIVIMLVMQFKILPIVSNLNVNSGSGSLEGVGGSSLNMNLGNNFDVNSLSRPFLYLLITQGFFVGLVIGKIAEGSVKYGFKHSFALVALAWLISTGAKVILG